MMKRINPWMTALVAAALCLGVETAAQAQNAFADTGGSSLFNNRISSGSYGTGAGLRSGGGSAIGGNTVGDSQLSLESVGNMLFDASRFEVGNRQVGQFVGSDLLDPTKFVGASTAGRSAASTMRRRQPTRPTQPGIGPGGGPEAGAGRTQFRNSVRIGFASPGALSTERLTRTLVQRLSLGAVQPTNLPPVRVTVEGRTATLRGVVPTEHDRLLARQLARLEPGISVVNSELTVAQTPATELPATVPPPALPPAEPALPEPALPEPALPEPALPEPTLP